MSCAVIIQHGEIGFVGDVEYGVLLDAKLLKLFAQFMEILVEEITIFITQGVGSPAEYLLYFAAYVSDDLGCVQ